MDYRAARTNMVDSQVRTNKVIDPEVIDALREVPRERFVPPALRGAAYVDEDLPIGGGRYLMEPMVLARLLQAAQFDHHETVLVVGAGPGYSAALVARLAGSVIALESDPALADIARTELPGLGAGSVTVVTGPLAEGAPAHAPFAAILVDGAVAELPTRLIEQLADGGRMMVVVKRQFGLGQALRVDRIGGRPSVRVLFDAASPLLPGFEPAEGFVF